MKRILLLLCVAASARAATISGTVYVRGWEYGNIPGAQVVLTGPSLQGTRVVASDERGMYRFIGVPAGGDYRVEAILSGFMRWPMTIKYVYAGDDARVDLPLDITIPECTLGRVAHVDPAAPRQFVFRQRR